jgi:hypothetical protein
MSAPRQHVAARPAAIHPRAAEPSAVDLLRRANQIVTDAYRADDRLAQAVRHLIQCAEDAAELLPGGDLDTAREALGCARAAVGAATYAVRAISDSQRSA